MQQLEGKITGELSSLQERVSTMQAELHTYRDLDTLRLTAEERKKVTANSFCAEGLFLLKGVLSHHCPRELQ